MNRLPVNTFVHTRYHGLRNHIFICGHLRWAGELCFGHGLDSVGTLIRFICTDYHGMVLLVTVAMR